MERNVPVKRFCGNADGFTIGALFGEPQFEQIRSGLARALNPQAMRGQVQAWNVRVVITGGETRFFYLF